MSTAGRGGSAETASPVTGSPSTDSALRVVIEGALAAVVMMDEAGDVTGWSGTATTTFGWSADEVVGRPLASVIVPPQYRDAHIQGLERYRQTGDGRVLGSVLELSALHRDGHEFPVEIRISEAAQIEGRTTFVAFIFDISERLEARTQLTSMYEEAVRAQEAMSAFSSMIVHELRGPLAVITGYASMLEEQLPDPWRSQITAVMDQAAQLSHLVDHLLLASRLEAGSEQAVGTLLDMGEMAREAVARARPRADLAGIAIAARLPDGDALVQADGVHVSRILDNLLGNAISYGHRGGHVVVSVVREGAEIHVQVRDDGAGIAPEMRDRVFDRFFRVSERSGPSGTGLGLYICRELAHRQGGRVVLTRSKVGVGSTFALYLPAW